MDKEEIKAELLFKLYRRGIWGGRHTPIKNLYHLADKISIREAEKAVKDLANLNMVTLKKSTGEIHISLNTHKKDEIRTFILGVLRIDPKWLD